MCANYGIQGLHKNSLNVWIQYKKLAIKIIYENLDYQEALTIAGLPFVKQRRIDMCEKLLTQMQNENHTTQTFTCYEIKNAKP